MNRVAKSEIGEKVCGRSAGYIVKLKRGLR